MQQLFGVAGTPAKHFPGTPTRAKPVFHRGLQSKHSRPTARLGFEILELLSSDIAQHTGFDFYLLFHIVRVPPMLFFVKGHKVPLMEYNWHGEMVKLCIISIVLRENTQDWLFWCFVHRNRHVMQVHVYNEWTWDNCLKISCNKLLTNDLQQESVSEWLLHMCLEKRYSSKSICLWTNNEKTKRKNSSNKYETANYSLSSVGNNQFLW